MKLKMFQRSMVTFNSIVFVLFSLVFLHVQQCLGNKTSAFDMNFFWRSDFTFLKLASVTALISIIAIYKQAQVSKPLLMAHVGLVFAGLVSVLISFFDKSILFMSFIYIILGYYFVTLWGVELQEAYLNPNFDLSDIEEAKRFFINARLVSADKEWGCQLTNWSESGCFIKLLNPSRAVADEGVLTIQFGNREFTQAYKIMTEYGNGVGYGLFLGDSFKQKGKGFNWKQFYKIVYDRGYIPEYLN